MNAEQRTPGTQKGSPSCSKGGRTKYKRQKETKDLGTETDSGERVMKEKFPNSRKPSHRWVCGEFWNFRGQQPGGKEKKTNPRIRCLTTTVSGELAQTLASASSKRGLYREA